jgi:hypothetical protein
MQVALNTRRATPAKRRVQKLNGLDSWPEATRRQAMKLQVELFMGVYLPSLPLPIYHVPSDLSIAYRTVKY